MCLHRVFIRRGAVSSWEERWGVWFAARRFNRQTCVYRVRVHTNQVRIASFRRAPSTRSRWIQLTDCRRKYSAGTYWSTDGFDVYHCTEKTHCSRPIHWLLVGSVASFFSIAWRIVRQSAWWTRWRNLVQQTIIAYYEFRFLWSWRHLVTRGHADSYVTGFLNSCLK